MASEDHFIPNYYRVEKHLRDRIRSGELSRATQSLPNPSSSNNSTSAA